MRTSPTQSVFIYYGDSPNFANCTSSSQSGTNLISLNDARFDLTQYGGPFYGTYADALALIGNAPIVRLSLVLDGGWGGDQVIDLTSATVGMAAFTDTFAPNVTPPTPVCRRACVAKF